MSASLLLVSPGSPSEARVSTDNKYTLPLSSLGDLVLTVTAQNDDLASVVKVQRNDFLRSYLVTDPTGSNPNIFYDTAADAYWTDVITVTKNGQHVIPNLTNSYFRVGVPTGEYSVADGVMILKIEISQRDSNTPYTLGEIQTLINNTVSSATIVAADVHTAFFSANASQSIFVIGQDMKYTNKTEMFVNGIKQQYGSDFNIDSNPQRIVFSNIDYQIQSGDWVEVRYYLP